jgi:hypothetical protein
MPIAEGSFSLNLGKFARQWNFKYLVIQRFVIEKELSLDIQSDKLGISNSIIHTELEKKVVVSPKHKEPSFCTALRGTIIYRLT